MFHKKKSFITFHLRVIGTNNWVVHCCSFRATEYSPFTAIKNYQKFKQLIWRSPGHRSRKWSTCFGYSRTACCGVNKIPLRYMTQSKTGGLGYTFLPDYLRTAFLHVQIILPLAFLPGFLNSFDRENSFQSLSIEKRSALEWSKDSQVQYHGRQFCS